MDSKKQVYQMPKIDVLLLMEVDFAANVGLNINNIDGIGCGL